MAAGITIPMPEVSEALVAMQTRIGSLLEQIENGEIVIEQADIDFNSLGGEFEAAEGAYRAAKSLAAG